MKKILTLIALAGIVTFTACKKDEETSKDSPKITVPTGVQVQVGTSTTLAFEVSAPGKIKTVTASSGTVVDQMEGETSATIEVEYTAPATAGNQTVTLTVADAQSPAKTSEAVATVEVTAEPVPEVVVVSGTIDANTTWSAANIYELASKVFVTEGATLTIEAGTIVKSREGNGSSATGLYIARGGKIMAVGTPEKPIIFTSVLDDIQPGQLQGSNLDADVSQLWGGLVLLGKAPISVSGGTEATIEGVAASEPLGLYGGDDPADNSGTLKYVSIRHGGTTIDPVAGKDINGLTLGGVGSGTTIENVEIIYNYDDGVEFFGGSVNVKNLLVAHQEDDGIDIDQAYSGTIDNFMVILTENADDAFEIDGPEGSLTGKFTVKNGTVVADGATGENKKGHAGDFKSKAMGTFNNVKYEGFAADVLEISFRASYQTDCTTTKTDAFSNLIDGELVLSNVNYDGAFVYTESVDGSDMECDVEAGADAAAEGKITTGTATGATDASVWDDWTLSSLSGLL